MQTFFDIAAFAAGFGACWFSKDVIVRFIIGSEAVIQSLEAKIATLKARL